MFFSGRCFSVMCFRNGEKFSMTTKMITFLTISALIEPVTYKAVMVVTFSGITCPPDRSDEIFDIITEEKFRDVDMRGFQNTLVSTQNFYTTDKCKVKWLVEFDGTQADRSPEDLRAVVAAERTALYGKKRFAAEEEESDRDESTFQVECPPGSGISSEDLYCGKFCLGLMLLNWCLMGTKYEFCCRG